jgi:hypothetical protein
MELQTFNKHCISAEKPNSMPENIKCREENSKITYKQDKKKKKIIKQKINPKPYETHV